METNISVYLTTTGTPATVTIDDLGGVTFNHPTSNLLLNNSDQDLTLFTLDEILESKDFATAFSGGQFTLAQDAAGTQAITALTDLQAVAKANLDNDAVGLGNVLNQEQALASDLGQANGIATLDATGKVPTAQLPDTVTGALFYKGTWNANTNSPSLSSSGGGGDKGDYYVVFVAGTTNLDGITDWQIGDWVVNNGSAWEKIDNSDKVSSVNGQTGTVILDTDDVPEGTTNKYYSSTLFNNDFATKDTDDLTEGTTNKYYSTTLFNTDFGNSSIDDLSDVDDTDKSDGDLLQYNSGTGNLEYVDPATLTTEAYEVIHFSAGRNKNTSNTFLQRESGSFTNETPFIVPTNATIIGISASSKNVETWDAEVYVNGSEVTQLAISAADKGQTYALSVDVNAGDEISMYCNGSGIRNPGMSVFLQRR
jgi:hypothetical protein